MPIVLQPADSGFNSHLRGITGGGSSARAGDVGGVGPESATPVPFLRILYEREVATLSMPHLKSLEIDLQVTRRRGLDRVGVGCDLPTSSLPGLARMSALTGGDWMEARAYRRSVT